MKKNILKELSWIVIIVIFLCACNNQGKEEKSISSRAHSSVDEKLIQEIICQGKIESYQTLLNDYSDNFRYEEMLTYSLIMANKYDYPQAYFDVFDILTSIPNQNASICVSKECLDEGFYCLDDKTKQMAIDYFKQAIYKGNIKASERLLNYYNKGKKFPVKEFYSDEDLIKKAFKNKEK